jgi:hypothetical protein
MMIVLITAIRIAAIRWLMLGVSGLGMVRGINWLLRMHIPMLNGAQTRHIDAALPSVPKVVHDTHEAQYSRYDRDNDGAEEPNA